jgi:hypothetical protein
VITEKRKRSLNSVIKGHFPTELFRKNVVFDRYDKEYQNEYVFEDSLNWNSGSPMCLYDTVNISETTKTSFKVEPLTPIKLAEASNAFDGSYSFILSRSNPSEGSQNLGTGMLEIINGKISVSKKYRYLSTSSTSYYDTFEGQIDKEGNINVLFDVNALTGKGSPVSIAFIGNIDELQIKGKFDDYFEIIIQFKKE